MTPLASLHARVARCLKRSAPFVLSGKAPPPALVAEMNALCREIDRVDPKGAALAEALVEIVLGPDAQA